LFDGRNIYELERKCLGFTYYVMGECDGNEGRKYGKKVLITGIAGFVGNIWPGF
jgi:hypothetical protein